VNLPDKNHWGVCETHRLKWHIGRNLYSSWQHVTEADCERNAERLADYREVAPCHGDKCPACRRRPEEQAEALRAAFARLGSMLPTAAPRVLDAEALDLVATTVRYAHAMLAHLERNELAFDAGRDALRALFLALHGKTLDEVHKALWPASAPDPMDVF
jgi:hypothetical protein